MNTSNKELNWEEEFDEKFPVVELRIKEENRYVTGQTARNKIKPFIKSLLTSERERMVGEIESKIKYVEKDYDGYPKMKSLENVGYNKAIDDIIKNQQSMNGGKIYSPNEKI